MLNRVMRIMVCLAIAGRLQAGESDPQAIRDIVMRAMAAFEVPGLGLAVVSGEGPILVQGFGLRDLADTTKVDSQTRFQIASNTKAFTATALATLVDGGELDWETRVTDVMPGFRLSDPYVTSEFRVRDLLVHRSGLGLGAGDLLWWPESNHSRGSIVSRLRHLPLEHGFRAQYAYDNVLFIAAGEVVASVADESWESVIETRLFGPLKMTRTTARFSRSQALPNTAHPYARIDGSIQPVNPFEVDNANPAAGITSCAKDMAQWLGLFLRKGQFDEETRIFSQASADALWQLVTPINSAPPPPEITDSKAQFSGYGLGFGVRDFRGHKVVMHGGLMPGYASRVAFMPDQDLGIVILTNQESSAPSYAITYQIFDQVLGRSDTDWIQAYVKLIQSRRAKTQSQLAELEANRQPDSGPSLDLAAYRGVYKDAWYGEITIAGAATDMLIAFSHTPALRGTLEHWQHDTFLARWDDRSLRADAFVTFSLNPDGTIDQAKMQAFAPDTDFSFDFQDLVLHPIPDRQTPDP